MWLAQGLLRWLCMPVCSPIAAASRPNDCLVPATLPPSTTRSADPTSLPPAQAWRAWLLQRQPTTRATPASTARTGTSSSRWPRCAC